MSKIDQKATIIELINKIENGELLSKLENVLFKYQFEEEQSRKMTIEEFNLEMEKSILDIKEGRTISVEDLEIEVAKWS